MKKTITKIALVSAALLPMIARAEDLIDLSKRLLRGVGDIVSILIPIVFGMTILAFFWGVFRYVFSQSSDGKQEAKKVLLWALIAVFIMTSVFGIVRLLQLTLGVQGGGVFAVPKIYQP